MKREVRRSLAALVATFAVACSPSPPAGSGTTTAPVDLTAPPTSTSTPSASVSPSASPSDRAIRRVELSGRGPLGLAVDGDEAWLVAHDSGQLISVDLATGRQTEMFEIGAAATHVVVHDDSVIVGRYGTDGIGEHLMIVRRADGTISGIETGPLGGVALAEEGLLWAFEKSGVVLLIDPVDRRVMDRVPVEIQQNEHVEAVAGAGSVWVSSDSTPIRRVTGPDLAVRAEIDADGGIPFVFRDGLIWGARPDELWAIDPATDDVTRRIELTGLIEILALDVRDGEAWIAARRPGRIGTVVRIDLDDGRLLGEFAVSLPAAVAITDTEVWVTNAGASELLGLPR